MNQFGSLTKLISIDAGRLGRLGRPPGEPRTSYRPAGGLELTTRPAGRPTVCSFVFLKPLC